MLEQALESLEIIVTYLVNFADVDDDTEEDTANAIAKIRKVLNGEKAKRDDDLQNTETAAKWTDKDE
jgi:UDP-N-acetylglucosamine 2-epimerase